MSREENVAVKQWWDKAHRFLNNEVLEYLARPVGHYTPDTTKRPCPPKIKLPKCRIGKTRIECDGLIFESEKSTIKSAIYPWYHYIHRSITNVIAYLNQKFNRASASIVYELTLKNPLDPIERWLNEECKTAQKQSRNPAGWENILETFQNRLDVYNGVRQEFQVGLLTELRQTFGQQIHEFLNREAEGDKELQNALNEVVRLMKLKAKDINTFIKLNKQHYAITKLVSTLKKRFSKQSQLFHDFGKTNKSFLDFYQKAGLKPCRTWRKIKRYGLLLTSIGFGAVLALHVLSITVPFLWPIMLGFIGLYFVLYFDAITKLLYNLFHLRMPSMGQLFDGLLWVGEVVATIFLNVLAYLQLRAVLKGMFVWLSPAIESQHTPSFSYVIWSALGSHTTRHTISDGEFVKLSERQLTRRTVSHDEALHRLVIYLREQKQKNEPKNLSRLLETPNTSPCANFYFLGNKQKINTQTSHYRHLYQEYKRLKQTLNNTVAAQNRGFEPVFLALKQYINLAAEATLHHRIQKIEHLSRALDAISKSSQDIDLKSIIQQEQQALSTVNHALNPSSNPRESSCRTPVDRRDNSHAAMPYQLASFGFFARSRQSTPAFKRLDAAIQQYNLQAKNADIDTQNELLRNVYIEAQTYLNEHQGSGQHDRFVRELVKELESYSFKKEEPIMSQQGEASPLLLAVEQ